MDPSFKNSLRWHSNYIRNGLWIGSIAGIIYAIVEGVIDEVPTSYFFTIISRGLIIGSTIGTSIGFFEVWTYYRQRKFAVWQLLFIKTFIYVIIINIWLLAVNAIYMYFEGVLYAFVEYLKSGYMINLTYSLVITVVMVTIMQLGKLHRRNELLSYILGKYHKPVSENVILLFVDLKGSTSLAESIGDVKYARYLKEYYADISESIYESGGDVYQYVGDEIVIFWKTGSPEKNQRCIMCHEMILQKIAERKGYYLEKYGMVPEFRASLHTGNVVMTWVGEMKREVLFIGDVLNTCSRMQEICKRLEKDFLISGEVLDILPLTDEYHYPFEEKLIPRGKQKEILVFSVEKQEI